MVKRFSWASLVGLIAVFTIAGASTAMSDKSDARAQVLGQRSALSRRRSTRASPPTRRRPTSSPT